MTLNHWTVRTTLVALLVLHVRGLLLGQQPFSSGGPTFDPYAAYQQPSNQIIAGPALPPGGPSSPPVTPAFPPTYPFLQPIAPSTVLQQPLPVQAGYPVRFVLFGEYLYMRASDAAMTSYAVPVSDLVAPTIPPIPMGPVAAIEMDFESGFRAGFDCVWNEYSKLVFAYTQLDIESASQISEAPASPLAIQSLVLHPSTGAASTLFQDASGDGSLDLRLADLDYQRVFVEDWYRWDFLAGLRYGQLDQELQAIFTNPQLTETVDVTSNFEGGGIRFGTRGDWRSVNHGFFLYAQATTNFLAGQFSSRYSQTDSNLGTVTFTSRKDDRIVNVTDVELGLGWHSPTHRWWFSGGYMFSAWSDVVNPAGVIRAVQSDYFYPIRERLTFDGLVARAEVRF